MSPQLTLILTIFGAIAAVLGGIYVSHRRDQKRLQQRKEDAIAIIREQKEEGFDKLWHGTGPNGIERRSLDNPVRRSGETRREKIRVEDERRSGTGRRKEEQVWEKK